MHARRLRSHRKVAIPIPRSNRLAQGAQLMIRLALVSTVLAVVSAALAAQAPPSPESGGPGPGRSDPTFAQPSIAPGVNYTVPTEAEITDALGRIREYFVRST